MSTYMYFLFPTDIYNSVLCLCWELQNQLSSQQSVDVIPLLCVDVRPVDAIPLFAIFSFDCLICSFQVNYLMSIYLLISPFLSHYFTLCLYFFNSEMNLLFQFSSVRFFLSLISLSLPPFLTFSC